MLRDDLWAGVGYNVIRVRLDSGITGFGIFGRIFGSRKKVVIMFCVLAFDSVCLFFKLVLLEVVVIFVQVQVVIIFVVSNAVRFP